MNEDYLWDKIGSDAEIERLENAVAAFGYKETAPPMLPTLPANVLPFKKEPARRLFPLVGAAIAACLAFVAVGLGVLLPAFVNETTIGESAKTIESAKPVIDENSKPNAYEPVINDSPDANVEKPEISFARRTGDSKPSAKSEIVKARKNIQQNVQPTVYRKEAKADGVKFAKAEIRLTAEERQAYAQLRLALSITSSKLKLVKNKVEGVEEKTVSDFAGGR